MAFKKINTITYIIYAVYLLIMALLFVAPYKKGK